MGKAAEIHNLVRFSKPYDWDAIDNAVCTIGAVIVEGFLGGVELRALNDDIDGYLDGHLDNARAKSGSDIYDQFLGHKTFRLHGLVEKFPTTRSLIGNEDLIGWAERTMGPLANSVLLNAGEIIQIEPGEPAQFPHRDTDSWIHIPIEQAPLVVNAIIALDEMTLENGATHVAPGSWSWEQGRMPLEAEYARATMMAGDAVLFRGDVIHGGGANASEGRRRALSISYCVGWLRPVENSFLNVPVETIRLLPKRLQDVLGYAAHDGIAQGGGMIGLYENGDPHRVLEEK